MSPWYFAQWVVVGGLSVAFAIVVVAVAVYFAVGLILIPLRRRSN